MRLFNDTMGSLAMNAYDINDVSHKINNALQFRNEKLGKMESYSHSIDSSLSNMEKLLNKMMESI